MEEEVSEEPSDELDLSPSDELIIHEESSQDDSGTNSNTPLSYVKYMPNFIMQYCLIVDPKTV